MSAESKLNALVDGALRSHCLRAIYDLKIDRILNKNKHYLSVEEICSEIEENSINPEVLQRIMRYMTRFDLFDEKYEHGKFFFKTTEVLQVHEPPGLIDKIEVASKIKHLLTNKTDGKSLFEYVRGTNVWDYIQDDKNKRYKENFEAFMVSFSRRIIPFVPKIAEEIKLQGKSNVFTYHNFRYKCIHLIAFQYLTDIRYELK